MAVEPREAALDDPAARMDGETDLIGGLADDLDGDAGRVCPALGGIGRVGEGALDEREAAARGLEQRDSTIAVLDRSRVDLEHQRPAVGVGHRVPLAAQHLLASVVASRSSGLGGLHALAVDDGGTRGP